MVLMEWGCEIEGEVVCEKCEKCTSASATCEMRPAQASKESIKRSNQTILLGFYFQSNFVSRRCRWSAYWLRRFQTRWRELTKTKCLYSIHETVLSVNDSLKTSEDAMSKPNQNSKYLSPKNHVFSYSFQSWYVHAFHLRQGIEDFAKMYLPTIKLRPARIECEPLRMWECENARMREARYEHAYAPPIKSFLVRCCTFSFSLRFFQNHLLYSSVPVFTMKFSPHPIPIHKPLPFL